MNTVEIIIKPAGENKSLGQIGYEAYCASTNWKSLVTGAPLPQWAETKPEIRSAWEAAAERIRSQLDPGGAD